MRQITLDTETTGISHEQGHRIIEIGCVELLNRKLTGERFQVYINPERKVDDGAFRVHGISTEFLSDKPLFKDILQDFLDFIGTSELVIHNAAFDLGFLNAELKRAKCPKKVEDLCAITDTLVLARTKHPGQRNSLDALCKRFEVDNSNRLLHGALLDAELLALVYLALTGGQTSLFSDFDAMPDSDKAVIQERAVATLNDPVVIKATIDELKQHEDFLAFLNKKAKKA